MHINEITLHYDTRKNLSEEITWPEGEPEMTPFESAFLCGVLRKFSPQKIVEVGIASGGTSALISSCLGEIKSDFEIHSIDYYENFYRDESKKSGYIGREVDGILAQKGEKYTHKYWLGNVACSFVDKIGDDIDCLILDTVHSLPGELLDFLTLLPHLKEGCVLILHDLVYNHYEQSNLKQAYSNILLFSTIKGEKYINIDNTRKMGMPSIGAIVINDDTKKCVEDVFLSLLVTWRYFPIEEQIQAYSYEINKNYNRNLCEIFDAAVELNEANSIVKNQMYEFPFYYLPQKSNIVLYGAGVVGSSFFAQAKMKEGISVVRWIDSNADKMNMHGIDDINTLKLLDSSEYDFIVVAVEKEEVALEIISHLTNIGINENKILWKNPRIG